MMNELYFKNVSGIGDLYLEQVFNEFEGENIVFICVSDEEVRYLCVCYEMRSNLKWIICPISTSSLLALIQRRIDLYSVFEAASILTEIVYDGDGESSKQYDFDLFNHNFLPNKGTLLKPDSSLDSYVKHIYSSATDKKTMVSSVDSYMNLSYSDLCNRDNTVKSPVESSYNDCKTICYTFSISKSTSQNYQLKSQQNIYYAA